MPTFYFQKELAIKRDATDSAIHHDAVKISTIVSDSSHDMSKSPGNACDQTRMVNVIGTLPVTESPLDTAQDSRQVRDLDYK